MSRAYGFLAALILCALVCDCGGGPYLPAGSGTGGGTSASPGGVWTGTDPVSQLSLTGLIDEAGAFRLIRSDGAQYVGTAAVTGQSISANFDGYATEGGSFPDGSHHGTGHLSGTVVQQSSITAAFSFTTDSGTASSGTLTLTFSATYNVASALATIAGNYTAPNSGDVYSITSAGAVTWQDPTTGCIGNGTITIINATYNLYALTFDLANCTGTSTVLNGISFSGFVSLDNSITPEELIGAATGLGSGNVTYSVTLLLNKN